MANVPEYQPTIGVGNPGVPDVKIQPITPASSRAGVYEAQASVGKDVTELSSHIEQHLVMQEKLKTQQEDYAVGEAYKSALQDKMSNSENTGILDKFQGVNAPQAVPAFDQMVRGQSAQPGKPGTPALRSQVLQQMGIDPSAYGQARLERVFDSAESMYRGKLINHVLSQKESADQAITEAKFDSEKKDAALITPTMVDDPANKGKLIPSIQLAEGRIRDTVMNDVHLQAKGIPKEQLSQIAQDHVDEVAKLAIQANVGKNWQDAQKILDKSSASPEAKVGIQNTINGARTDQYTEALTKSVVNNPQLRSSDGQINEFKAQEYINSQIDRQEKSGTPLPPGHADAIVGKLQSQIAIQNKSVTQRQQISLAKSSNDIWGAMQSGMDPKQAYEKFIKNGQFDNAIERGKAEEVFTKVYEKDPSALDTVWGHMSEAQKTAVSQVENGKDFQEKFPYSEDKKSFMDAFKQKILEGRVQSPDAINKLYQDQIKQAPTGAVGLFGGIKTKTQYKIDESLQQNQPVVKAVGGLSEASKLAQSLGGAEKLAPDTNESKAILLLSKYGKPINASTISSVIEKHPDLLK